MFFGRVKDMRDPNLLEIGHVLDRLAVCQTDAGTDLK